MLRNCPVACGTCKLCANHSQFAAYRKLWGAAAPVLLARSHAWESGFVGVVARAGGFAAFAGGTCLGWYADALASAQARARYFSTSYWGEW